MKQNKHRSKLFNVNKHIPMARPIGTAASQESNTEEDAMTNTGREEYAQESESTRQRIPEPERVESRERMMEMPALIKAARVTLSVLIFSFMCAVAYFGAEYKKKRQDAGFGEGCGFELAKMIFFAGMAILLLGFRSCIVQKYRN